MARDYKKEYQQRLAKEQNKRTKMIAVKLLETEADEFETKLALDNTNKNAKLKEWIYAYLRGELK